MNGLFGRAAELDIARRAIDGARLGKGSVVVVSGEPGIGKSTLARAVAEEAEAGGARIAFGRAWEVGGAPAYWPWSQALADLGLDLEAMLGDASGEMAGARRLVAFDRVAKRLCEIARERPLVVVLDDLHATDLATIELALYVARAIARAPVVLLVTTRENELKETAELGALVGKLCREGARIALARLGEGDLDLWLRSAGSTGDAKEMHRVTEGNPLFVEEAVRVGTDRFASLAGGGVSALLEAHVARASPPVRATLAAAAVLGREARVADVVAITGGPPDTIDAHLREGLVGGVLAAARAGEMAFAHILLRDVFFRSLAASRREELHARAADVLEARGAAPASVAHHLLEAGAHVSPERIIPVVLEAADAALRQHAIESALALVEEARTRLAGRLPGDSVLAFDLLVADAEMRRGRSDAARAACVTCAARAKAAGDAVAMARAALIYGSDILSGQVDPVMVRLLEEALAAISPGDTGVRARMLARLAAAKTPARTDEDVRDAIAFSKEAVASARETGDEATLVYCLRFAAAAHGYLVDAAERHALSDEIITLARARQDDLTLVQVGGFHIAQLAETGRLGEAERAADEYCAFIERLPLPAAHWRSPAIRSSLAAFRGNLDEADAIGDELHRLATEHGARPGLLAWALLQISLGVCREDRAPLAARDAEILSILGRVTTFGPWAACVHALLGRRDEALASLAPMLKFPRGFPWLITGGVVAVILEDANLAEILYPLLEAEQFRGRFFWGPAGVYPLGPTSRVLGELARLRGRMDDARVHVDLAVSQCRELGAVSLLQMSLRARARLDAPARSPGPASKAAAPFSITREGDVWRVDPDGGAAFRVKHAKGLEYLRELLDNPGRETYVLALVGADEGPEDAGEILDDRAKKAYRARVEELRDTLAEAERHSDEGRARRAREELDRLAEELASAVGLGGRDRKAASNVERARINVQRRLKDAIRRIAAQDPVVGRYLEATIRTGTYCAFVPV